MQISKSAWHYRFNNFIQGYSFRDRAVGRKFTTCSYIRTTIRSILQAMLGLAMILAVATSIVFMIGNAIYLPLAIWLDWTILKNLIPLAVMTWIAIFGGGAIYLLTLIGTRLRATLDERSEQKLSLLEQRIKDGKEGICTIIEVV